MARSGYSQKFTLLDIFNNPKLAGKLPLIKYREKIGADGKEHRTTDVRSVPMLIFDISKRAAKPFYKPLAAKKKGNTIDIDGTLIGDYDSAYEAVYNEILANRLLLVYTANNADVIRSALKEAQESKRKTGIEPKLYLRAGSMAEIEAMNTRQIQAMLTNVMENIYYSDAYVKTRMKYGLETAPVSGGKTYEQRQMEWKARVGE